MVRARAKFMSDVTANMSIVDDAGKFCLRACNRAIKMTKTLMHLILLHDNNKYNVDFLHLYSAAVHAVYNFCDVLIVFVVFHILFQFFFTMERASPTACDVTILPSFMTTTGADKTISVRCTIKEFACVFVLSLQI
jgi:hypothetical protein